MGDVWLNLYFIFFLALAAKKIAIGVVYAVWEGLGIALITLVSVFVFDAQLNTQQFVGLAMATVGIVLVTLGEEHKPSLANKASE